MKVEKVRLRVFGVLRNFSDESGFWDLDFQSPVEIETGADLKRELIRHFSNLPEDARLPGFDPEILSSCAIADDEQVLAPGSRLSSIGNLALLPPVCGG
jgi:hypothetical protein